MLHNCLGKEGGLRKPSKWSRSPGKYGREREGWSKRESTISGKLRDVKRWMERREERQDRLLVRRKEKCKGKKEGRRAAWME